MIGRRCCGGLWAAALLALAASVPAPAPFQHHLSKRSFYDQQCMGVFDQALFARVDRICEDCYNLYRDVDLLARCRKDCFTTEYYKGCVDALLKNDELPDLQTSIKQLKGGNPNL